MTAIVFIDIETLNLNRPALGDDPGVWDAAVILCNMDLDARTLTAVDNWCGFIEITPDQLACADPASLRVNRFYERHPQYNQPLGTARIVGGSTLVAPEAAAYEIARICSGATMVAANPSFDEERLAWFCYAHGHTLAVDYHLGCVRQLAAGYLAGLDAANGGIVARVAFPPLSGSKLNAAIGIEPNPDAHTAWADCLQAIEIFAHIYQLRRVEPVG